MQSLFFKCLNVNLWIRRNKSRNFQLDHGRGRLRLVHAAKVIKLKVPMQKQLNPRFQSTNKMRGRGTKIYSANKSRWIELELNPTPNYVHENFGTSCLSGKVAEPFSNSNNNNNS